MDHPCTTIYALSSRPVYGDTEGICRITGQQSAGLPFQKWVKPTFTDHSSLKPGTIISNEALFCFDEASAEIQEKTGRDKPQRFRTYSHVVCGGVWKCYTKANKRDIFNDIISGAELVCLTDSGQKHALFKHRPGMWQLDELFITPDLELFQSLHADMQALLRLGFTQTSVIEGKYNLNFILKNGADQWRELEEKIKQFRGTPMFDFAAWMLFTDK